MEPSKRIRGVLRLVPAALVLMLLGGVLFNVAAVSKSSKRGATRTSAEERLFRKGKRIFRFDTFGDQKFCS